MGTTRATDRDRLRLVRALYPGLAEQLDRAHERFGVDHAGSDRAGSEPGGADFDDWLDAEADALRSGSLGSVGFSEITDAEARSAFERAFAAARTVSEWLEVSLPEPETFVAAGVPFRRLAAALRADPELRPVPAPYGLGPERWLRAFERAAERPGSPFEGAAEPLLFASEVTHEFGVLDAAPHNVVTASADADSRAWTLRLVPASERPPLLGLGFAQGPHVTLPEMLMLQLINVVTGEPSLDAHSFTWIAGPLADGRLAARHVYDVADRAVRISCRERGNQGPHLGARLPIA